MGMAELDAKGNNHGVFLQSATSSYSLLVTDPD